MNARSKPSPSHGFTHRDAASEVLEVAEVSFLQRSAAGPVRVWAVAGDDAHIKSLGSQVSAADPSRELIWNTFEVNGPDGRPCPAGSVTAVFAVVETHVESDIADTNCRVSILDVFLERDDAEMAAEQEREFETNVTVIEYPVNRVLFS